MKQSRTVNILFIAPCLFAFIMIIVIPFGFGLYYSLTDWNGVRSSVQFVGLANFIYLFTAPDFLYSFLITIGFTLINIVSVNVVGLFYRFW